VPKDIQTYLHVKAMPEKAKEKKRILMEIA
jgi:hypothetical protein